MRILLLAILLVGAPFVAAETEPEPPVSDADKPKKATGPLSPQEAKFQGTWKPGYALIIEGRDFCADTQPGEWYEGYIVIRTDEEPAQIDFVIEECACGFKGETSKGIFYSDGETIVVVAPPPGKARPQDFEKKDGLVILQLKRDGNSQYPATHCLGETP
jgi:uncharacterized protein (TIGR03067 family)